MRPTRPYRPNLRPDHGMAPLGKTRKTVAWITLALMLAAVLYAIGIGIMNWSEIMV